MSDAVKSAARRAERIPAVQKLARAGYAANGAVHILIGVIALAIAAGGDAESDQAGAMTAIGDAPLGFVALWLIAAALTALGIWHAFEGLLARDPEGDAKGAAKKWGRRASEWGQAAVFLALGVIAGVRRARRPPERRRVRSGGEPRRAPDSGRTARAGRVALGIGIGGVAFVVMGFLRSFRNKMTIPDSPLGRAVTALGVFGFIAKGIALVIVGCCCSPRRCDRSRSLPEASMAAIETLRGFLFGHLLVGIVGVGFIAYGVFCFFRARFARL